MSYFLRHFVHGTGAPLGESTSAASDDLSSTLLGLSFADFDHKQTIEAAANRERYSELLMRCAKTTFKNGMLGNANFVEKNSKIDSTSECTSEATKYVEVVAAPSLQGANFLALTTALRSIVQHHSHKTSSTAIETALDGPLVCPANAAQPHVSSAPFLQRPFGLVAERWSCKPKVTGSIPIKSHQLVAVSLDSIFSILLELNQRDADLCAQALQQLLQLLQAVPPEGFINEPKPTVIKMYDMLRKLRSEGNSNVSAAANACMVSLAIARGEPDLIFAAVQSLLCDPKENIAFNMASTECSELPRNFQSMAVAVQRSVQNTGTGNSQGTFWSIPLTEHAEIASFELTFPAGNLVSSDLSETAPEKVMSCLVSDGTYVYVLTTLGLFKVGTGLTESLCGKVAAFNDLLKFTEGSALFVCQESLYLRRRHSTRLWVIDRETLREIGEIMLHASLTEGVLFSDGRNFYQGTLDAQWNFMITPLDDSFGAIVSQKHKQFNRLVELNYVVFGNSFTNCQDRLLNAIPQQLQMIAIDFQFTDDTGFILTRTGEVFYAGRASTFNLSDTGTTWTELTLTEPIVQMHLDCNINCRLFLRSGSGHLWFVGSLSGLMDQQINHGMSHSKKLRKIRIPHRKRCTYISGISGAMSYVTDNGKCYLFGRHIMTTNNDNGQLTGFDGFSVASIGIGKTHVVAISKSGLVYTCGLNNLNQCGRDEPLNKPALIQTAQQQLQTDDGFRFMRQGSPRGRNSASPRSYCFPNEHVFIKDTASICMRCGQCSGRNNDSCPTKEISGGIKRITLNRGMTCVCDATDSVCLRCGICANCAESDNLNVDREEEDIGSRQPEVQTNSLPKPPMIFPQGTQLSPARLVLQGDIKVSTLSCGNYHTILLCADRSVYTFGSNCHGQLGTGDTLKRSGAYKLNLPSNIQVVQAVAGANHCVLRTLDGQVITFGAYKQGQLGREADPSNPKWFATPTAVPGYGQANGMIVSWVSAEGDQTILQTQKQTFSKAVLNDATITANKDCLVILAHADNTCEDYVIIKRNSSEVSRFKIDFERFGRMSFSLDPYYNLLWSFDDETFKVTAFSDAPDGFNDFEFPIANVESLASTLVSSSVFAEPALLKQHRQLLQCPELCVPESSEPEFSDPQMAIFLLTTIYSITVLAATGQLESSMELAPTQNQKRNSKFSRNRKPLKKLTATEVNLDHENGGFCAVNRFDSFGGGWGYSAHCVEAVQFKVNKSIRLCGIGLFGGRGEYSAKLKLLKVVGGGDLDEQCVELLAESDETIYECAPKETVVLQFDKNVTIKQDEWHVIWAQIHGPSSDCGASGKPMMNGTGNVEFTFRNSILSNNGTDVDVGQIPEIYYTLKTSKNDFDEKRSEISDRTPATESDSEAVLPLISAKTLFSITPGTISSLFDIFSWAMKGAFSTREYNVIVDDELLWKQERYAFVAVISLRMLRLYIALLAASNEAFQKADDTSEETAKQNFDEFANVVIDFSSILKNVFTVADEKSNPKDKIGGLVVEEAIDAYVACADLLLPSTALLRSRISQAIAQGHRNWSLLALLKACHRLEGQALAVLIPDRDNGGSINDNHKTLRTLSQTFSKYFLPTKNTTADELTGSAIIRFLFELAFAAKDSTSDPLTSRLRTAAQSLITVFAKCLVGACLHDDVEPPLIATDNRFRKFNNHLNWETGNGAHDGIAFRTDTAGITIYGIGIFVGAPMGTDFSYELETFINTGDMANECWSLIEQQNGSVKDTPGMNITQQEGPTAAVNQKLLTFVKLMKPISLKPDVIYAVRIHLSAGKTFYGDNGQTCVRLANGGRINFLPCSLSRNGTNIIRGQIPHLVYAVEEPKKKKSVVKQKSVNKEDKFWLVDNEVHNVFLDIMRLLAQKLSYLIAMNEVNTDEKLLSGQLIGYANVFLEANPNLGFHLVSAIDEVLPLLTAANADEVKHFEKVEHEEDISKPKVTQAIVESPHPYKSAQIYSQTVLFNASVEFVCVRFHDECQTAQPDDCLWIYVGHCDSGCWYPVGRYYGGKHWPEAQLLLPGNKLWFVLETVQPGEDLNPGAMYGFRCTVDGYCSTSDFGDAAQKPVNSMLEHQFAWLVASACRLLVAAPSGAKAVKKLREHEESTQELIRKHGGLLKRGLNIDVLPTIGDVIAKRFPGLVQTHERQFIDEFIKAPIDSFPGKLARIFSFEIPFVDLTLSTVEIEAGEVVVGKPVRLLLFQKDQFNRDARCTQLTAEISIASADDVVTHDHVNDADVANQNSSFGSGDSSLTGMTTDDHHNWRIGHTVGKDAFQTLRQLQTREPFASVYLNKARYKAISMMPTFSDYSFEELRLAFQNAPTTKEALRLSFDVSSGFYAVDWRPRRTGRFRIDCTVDGFKLASTTFIEVADRRTPAPSPRLFLDVSERAVSRSPDHDAIPVAPKLKKAFFNPLNCFSAVRIRVHPSLSAPTSGVIERGSTITWAEFLRNNDGTWLKLTDEAKMMFCNPIDQQNMGQDAWCLQYTRAFERILLEIDDGDINQSGVTAPVAPKTPRRQLPPIPPKRKKQVDEDRNRMQVHLDEDADVLTIKRTSLALSSTASSNQSTIEALGPRLIDTCRSVFAAIVWHERLVGDLMTCANHLKSHPGIEQLLPDLQQNPALPTCFPPLITLYRSTVQAVLEIIEQHLILPSPPALHGVVPPRQMYSPGEELCELCSELHPKPITVHMRQKHPGCGHACGGHGYNSIGNYTTGWTGLCGDGGDANAVWYLLCTNCRTEYLNAVANNEKSAEAKDPNDWNQLRQKAANKQSSAEHVLKQNSMFLLDLRPADALTDQMTRVTPKRIQYKVNLHPQGQMGEVDVVTSANFDDNIVDSDVIDAQPSPFHAISHQSDPGTAYPDAHVHASDFFTLSASANLFRSNKPQTPANGNTIPPKRPVRLASLTGLNGLLRHPVLLFAVEIHDLPKILSAFRRSIARATKFAYAFRVWNWLLKLVTSEAVVVDVVWSYLAALGSYLPYNRWLDVDMHFATRLKLLPHPWRLCFLGGSEVSKAMVDEMQAFLGTVAVILQSNGVDLSLKCLCFKAWTFQLTVHEQSLLLTLCNILSTVGAVLSDAGGDASSLFDESALSVLAGFSQQRGAVSNAASKKQPVRRFSSSHFGGGGVVIKAHENVSIELKVVASSRPQMTHCLTDGNLDTFWESGDEDKARTRRLTLSWDDDAVRVEMLAIFVDNIRDANYKVRQLIIKNSKTTLMNLDVDWNHVGWIKVSIPYGDPVQIQIKGSEGGSRLRQIAIYGTPLTPVEAAPGSKSAAKTALKSSTSHHLLFSTAQMDAFALFQAIAAQAFGDELAEEQNGTLRQQVIDMLFSRVQLQPLQSYVCFQMVSAVEREIISLRDRSKRNYSYVCGLMVMLVKICESRKGLEVFGLRNGLLVVLSELLLFAPEVVQMQVIATLGSLLRHFRPTALDCAQFLRNALASVAKSISLQIKDKVTRKINAHKMEEHAGDLPAHWKMDKVVSFDVAMLIIDFVNQITSGNFGEQWSFAVRTELANTVMSLAQLLSIATSGSTNSLAEPSTSTSSVTDTARTAQSLRSAQFWLAVTALCLITDAKWLELSSAWRKLHARRSKEPDPLCENHDDGRTLAHFRCDICASNLCRECFTILHLNKKKKSHNARLIGSSTLCPKIDVHEGCTRLRLNNLLILFNTGKLSGMVEISADIGAASHVAQSSSFGQFGGLNATAKCRFCATPLKTESESLAGVCSHADCAVMAADACDRILPCGHHCGGIKDESDCLACFVCENAGSKQDGDDLCVICFTDRLGAAPCIQLECGHFFHFACVKLILEKRWPGPRILFRFMHCPLCKAAIAHPALDNLLEPLRALLQDVSDKAKLRLEYDGLLNHPAITSEASEFYNNPVGFALEKYVYVLCNKCGKAYFGGEASCQEALDSSTAFNPEELLCGGCSDVAGAEICGLHGAEYLEYKCRFCCSVAVYFCFASTHFCAGCHADFQRLMPLPKSQLPQCPVGPRCVQLEGEECPLRVQHPPTGEEFSLGCGVCRNIRTF
uniref:RCR-type E3 ubiquitin transferase n=1 Tax=Panagrellus redivivus TaxID=6233 RepID=A0A7E4WAZ4_PANRE